MGCALLCLNEEKQLSHTPPSHLQKKKIKHEETRVKLLKPPPVPHIIKNNNTVAVRNRRGGRRTQPETEWNATTPLVLHRRETEVAVRAVWAVGSHCVIVTSVCDWRTSKGLARGEERRRGGVDRDEESRGAGGRGRSNEKRKEDGPFFFF